MSCFDKTRVVAVASDMERHCLGHEGMEDSPVARWARELRNAIKSDTSDAAEAQNTSCASAVDAPDVTSGARNVTREDREAAAWVREHGGIDYVRKEWRSRVPYDRYVRRRQSLLGHIAECETALGRRREIISELTHRVSDLTTENAGLRRRAMPDGCEWDGSVLRIRTAENVDYDGETLFVLIGGRDE